MNKNQYADHDWYLKRVKYVLKQAEKYYKKDNNAEGNQYERKC